MEHEPRHNPDVEEASGAQGSRLMARARIAAVRGLVVAILLALGSVTDSPLQGLAVEAGPPPVPASVQNRDASVTVTTHDEHGKLLAGARVSVLSEIDGRYYAAGGARTDARGVAHIASLPRGRRVGDRRRAWRARARRRRSCSRAERAPSIDARRRSNRSSSTWWTRAGAASRRGDRGRGRRDPLPYGARTDAAGRAEVGRLGDAPWVVTARALGYDETTARGVREGGGDQARACTASGRSRCT